MSEETKEFDPLAYILSYEEDASNENEKKSTDDETVVSLLDIQKFKREYSEIVLCGSECHLLDEDSLDEKSRKNIQRVMKYFTHLTARQFNWNVLTEEKKKAAQKLFEQYPNFSEVAEFFNQQFVIMEVSPSHRLHFDNILIWSNPGCGKSSFVKKLVKILSPLSHVNVALGGGNTDFTLVGSDKGYSGAEAGNILKSMFSVDNNGPIPNPIVVLDEIDKVSWKSNKPERDLNGVFSELLETGNSKEFTDLFMNVPVDASKINYIALANNKDNIPEHILSRFGVQIFIPDYSEEEMKEAVIPGIYSDYLKENELEKVCPSELSREFVDAVFEISGIDTRKVRSALGEIALKSLERLADGKSTCFRKFTNFSEKKRKSPPKTRQIGFSL